MAAAAPTPVQTITLTRPDDFHHHFRDGAALACTVPHASRVFGRAIAMPNLVPPVRTTADALLYRERILAAQPEGGGVEPLMTLYMTDNTSPADIRTAKDSGLVHAVKLYPQGATTNSDFGVTDLTRIRETLQSMADLGLPLLVHGEVTHADVDVFDKEATFITDVLQPLVDEYRSLRVVLEHVTTSEAVEFVRSAGPRVGATITAHHLLYNRNAVFRGGLRPHMYCLPILKAEEHRRALVGAATGGEEKFWLGTDSAPHARGRKESACGCAGIFTGHAAIELYAEAFDAAGALPQLEAFASHHGADFYGLPRNTDVITLSREAWDVPPTYPLGNGDELVPLRGGERVAWRVLHGARVGQGTAAVAGKHPRDAGANEAENVATKRR